ncbi:hypothetical protein LB941_08520 [Ligilactobacillus sp. WILCCON 0076]|uniref:ABC transporter ATP-binding protein n=1 Tax=Ligilactobacillus ubinensis TaxID=2876789 RepID=A0A9X2FKJ2_9LACO|nr:hypothetical protein [Ligilactobacillus ubinensis]MCP0887377.1 hypothetical protein [Ligilactobacillus ubinensis]
MMDLLLDLIKQGKAVLLTSHNIDELQNISDYVYILKKGQIFEEGTISEVINRNQTTDSYILETDYIDQVSSILIELSITYRILNKNNLIEVLADLNVMNKLVLILLERNILIKGFTRKLNSLRDIAFEE